MRFFSSLVLVAACFVPLAANAQWQWLDSQGKKVFSDQPPPIDVPDKRILRRPVSSVKPGPAEVGNTDGPTTPASAVAVATAKPASSDKELEEKARKTQEAEKAKRAVEEKRLAADKAENCRRARENKSTLDSGVRVARVNEKGERDFMDDNQRAAEQRRTQSIIESDCK